MGSAAPSRRRWKIALLLAMGALVFALVPLVDRSDPPAVGGPASSGGGEAGARPATGDGTTSVPSSETTAVILAAGWEVPARIEGDADHQHPGPAVHLSPGAPTFGGESAVPPESSGFVVRTDIPRRLAVRLRADEWQPWLLLATGSADGPDAVDGEEGADSALAASIPLLSGQADRVQVVDLDGIEQPIELAFLPSLEAMAPSGDPGPAAPSAVAGDGPSILPRSAWTSAGWAHENGSCDEGPRIADHLQAVVVHHTVTGNSYGADQVDDLIRAIHYSHTEINGWCDIGYNFVVDRFGRIWEARSGSLDHSVIGGHARGFNTATLGVALLGQHQAGAWPAASTVSSGAQDAVAELAAWKLEAEGVDPKGTTWLRNRSSATPSRLAPESWHLVPTVLGHRDLGLTSCPGSHGYTVVAGLDDRLAAGQSRDLPYGWVDWRPHDHGPGFAIADARGGVRPAGTASPWSQAPDGTGGAGSVVAIGGNLGGGYLLAADGTLIGFGAAPAVARPGVVGDAVDLVVRSDGISGWVLDRSGTLRGFGGMADLGTSVSDPVAAALDDGGLGYVLDRSGTLVPVGGAPAPSPAWPSGAAAVDLALSGSGGAAGGWILATGGRLVGFGGQPDYQLAVAAEPVAVATSPTEPGGWILDRTGQLWPFGGARYIFPVSTDVATADVVDIATVGLVYSADFLDSADARYLDATYRLFLARAATEVELDQGAAGLEQGRDRIDLTSVLALSDTWAGEALDQMYRDVLGREPDPDGRQYWMGQIGAGLKLQDLGTYFYGSSEYATAAGSEEAYVRGLYQVLLHREPDGEGLSYWIRELQSGRATPPDVAAGFYTSIESRRDRVSRIHQRVMQQPPDPTERDDWAERLPALGDVGLAAELAASRDFYRRAADGPEP